MSGSSWFDQASLPELLRGARDAYRDALREALVHSACDDMPRNGVFVLLGLDHGPDPSFRAQSDVVAPLGLSKQAASQLIDTMVVRNYLERRNDPADRRRMEVRLTSRGLAAARALHHAIDEIEGAVAEQLSADELHGLRAGLAAFQTVAGRAD